MDSDDDCQIIEEDDGCGVYTNIIDNIGPKTSRDVNWFSTKDEIMAPPNDKYSGEWPDFGSVYDDNDISRRRKVVGCKTNHMTSTTSTTTTTTTTRHLSFADFKCVNKEEETDVAKQERERLKSLATGGYRNTQFCDLFDEDEDEDYTNGKKI